MSEYMFVAGEEDEGMRIDVYITSQIEDISRSGMQKLLTSGLVTVNGKGIKQNYRLRTGDVMKVTLPTPVEMKIEPENITLSVLYEDSELIVVDKPQDMVVHPAPGHMNGTLVNALLYHCGGELSGINGVLRPGVVHRIDKDTSGALVVAKTNTAHQCLAAQLANHSMKRIYNAIVFHNIKEDELTIDKPVGRSASDRKKMAVTTKNARQAITHIKVLERFGRYTLIQAKLETGRTHQVRVHMSSIGHPLLGDQLYGPDKQPFKLNGQALHARVLGFVHPNGEYMEFESEPPEYFSKLLSILVNQIQ